MYKIGIVAAMVSLVSCSPPEKSEHNPNICGPIDAGDILTMPKDYATQYQTMRQCTEKWAARLSRSNEPTSVVVDATIEACRDTFTALSQFAEQEGKSSAGIEDAMRRMALFRVVQWRAGKCDLP